MNFAQMLMRPVTSLEDRRPVRGRETYNTKPAAGARADKAKKHYWTVMHGKGWMTTTEIEHACGYKPRTARKWLDKAYGWGTVDKRPVGGSYKPGRGWEWRWK